MGKRLLRLDPAAAAAEIEDAINSPALGGFDTVLRNWQQPALVDSTLTVPNEPTVSRENTVSTEHTVSTLTTVSRKRTVSKVSTVSRETQTPIPPKRRRARTAQDGHSLAEQAVYDVLWKTGQPGPRDEWREVAIGYDALGNQARIGWSTAKRALRSLEAKFSVERVGRHDSDSRTGTRYRVYSYRTILERRRGAGLDWIERNRGGVTLHTTLTVSNVDTVPNVSTVPTVDTVPTVNTGAVSNVNTETVSNVGTPLENSLEKREGKCPLCNDTGVREIDKNGFPRLCGCRN